MSPKRLSKKLNFSTSNDEKQEIEILTPRDRNDFINEQIKVKIKTNYNLKAMLKKIYL